MLIHIPLINQDPQPKWLGVNEKELVLLKHIYSLDHKRLRIEEDTPICGVDFCEHCGDCLACYGDVFSYCCHYWVVYEDDIEDRELKIKELQDKTPEP